MKDSEQSEEVNLDNELILVGFGKHDLTDLVEKIGTDEELIVLNAAAKWPARWRRMKICKKEELDAMKKYVEYTTEKLNKATFGGL